MWLPFLFRRLSQRKRGRRGGICRKMKKLCLDNRRQLPPLPSVFLSNAQSLRRKIDELEIWAKYKRELKECCLLAITETWLNESDQDSDPGSHWIWLSHQTGPLL